MSDIHSHVLVLFPPSHRTGSTFKIHYFFFFLPMFINHTAKKPVIQKSISTPAPWPCCNMYNSLCRTAFREITEWSFLDHEVTLNGPDGLPGFLTVSEDGFLL